MALVSDCPPATTARKLRAHRKSRQGCGNCKLRKVKCDEGKPECKQCRAYNVMCAYDTIGPRLQSSFVGTEVLSGQSQSQPKSDSQMIPSGLPSGLGGIQGGQDFGHYASLLDRFRQRTNETIGMRQHRKRPDLYLELSVAHPFLLHIVLTLTIMHDRYLGVDVGPKQNKAMAFHWSRGAALLNDKITKGVKEQSEKDALWASAVLLATLAFASVEGETPDGMWPLKPSSSTDLDWLKLIEGKKEIWKIADPHRAASVFCPQIPRFVSHMSDFAAPDVDLSGLPSELVGVCGIDDTSSTKNNPYLLLLSTLASLNSVACTPDTFGVYFGFFGAMDSEFKRLLARKDPPALLILASWYARVCHLKHWWLWRRASLECRAICGYLRLFHTDNPAIMSVVPGLEA